MNNTNTSNRNSMDQIITIILQIALFSYLVYALSGCSVKFELGYHGKTGRDDLTTSEEISTQAVKSKRY